MQWSVMRHAAGFKKNGRALHQRNQAGTKKRLRQSTSFVTKPSARPNAPKDNDEGIVATVAVVMYYHNTLVPSSCTKVVSISK
jgi:hypothetical protein